MIRSRGPRPATAAKSFIWAKLRLDFVVGAAIQHSTWTHPSALQILLHESGAALPSCDTQFKLTLALPDEA